jgi:hypothetical protein
MPAASAARLRASLDLATYNAERATEAMREAEAATQRNWRSGPVRKA